LESIKLLLSVVPACELLEYKTKNAKIKDTKRAAITLQVDSRRLSTVDLGKLQAF
jgi:hypothetical protein